MKATFTAQQFAALALVELTDATLRATATALKGFGATSLERACTAAADSLVKAHEAFVAETQRAVSIAAPDDVARLVTGP